jgi:rhomboid family GlyGly-CTERM serine protease
VIPRSALLLGIVLVALALMPEGVGASLAFDRLALADGQVWRLWTAHLVHFPGWHAPIDIAALCIVAGVAERLLGARRCWVAFVLGAPLISLGLFLLVPEMAEYRGSSAIAYLLCAAIALALWRSQPGQRPLIVLVGMVVGIKLLLDAFAPAAIPSSLPMEVRVAWQAHVLGALVAVAGDALSRWSWRTRHSILHPPI